MTNSLISTSQKDLDLKPSPIAMKKLFIIDAVNYLFRSYYAIGPMTNDQGESTSALYGFIRSLQKLIKEYSHEDLIVVFDGPDNKRERQKVYAEYKMHRKGAPEDLFPQFEWAYDYCQLAGLPVICVEGVEADDTMASIAVWAAKDLNREIYLCTSDKDLCQIVGNGIYVLNVHKNSLVVDSEKVLEIYGVRPDQMLDFLAIMGDTSDNIPGLPGFGPKTAAQLLQKFGTLDNILSSIDEVPGKKKQEILTEHQDKAILSKKLARLNTSVAFPKEEEFFKVQEPNIEKLKDLFHRMKFTTLLKELTPTAVQEELFEKVESVEKEVVDYILIDEEEALQNLVAKLIHEKEICVDTETTDLHPLTAQIVGLGLCVEPKVAYYIPFNGNLGTEMALHYLKKLFSEDGPGFYGHNLKYDYHVLKNHGIEIKKISFDTMLASYLLAPQNRRHNLYQLALEYFRKHKVSIKDLIGTGKKQISMKEVPIEKVKDYCCEDVDLTTRLKLLFETKLKYKELDLLLYDIELPLLPILANMERHGIYLDVGKIKEMSVSLDFQIKAIEEVIFSEVGEIFNLNSPKQLSEILYQRLGLTPPGRKKTEYSTAAKVLETLAEENPVVGKILEYRGLEKLRSTYVNALPEQVQPVTERIHCSFNQSVTATGRLSCTDPNLQNIPVRTVEGRKIREGFRPQKPGWSYLAADYSQIELRLVAHFSKDPELLKAFQQGEDIHTHTASLVFNVPQEEVTKEMRYQAKAVNFGILYGQGPYGLARELKIPMWQASDFIKAYFHQYPKVSEYLEECKEKVRKEGYAQTLFGRKRPIAEIFSKNPSIRAAAERLAVNTPLQGTTADIIKLAMIRIDSILKERNPDGFMILQIHDELIFEIPDREVETFKKIVKENMEHVIDLNVPLLVDIEVGKNWGEC